MVFKRTLLLLFGVIFIWLVWLSIKFFLMPYFMPRIYIENEIGERVKGIFQEVKPVLRGRLIVADDYFYKFGDSAKPIIEFV